MSLHVVGYVNRQGFDNMLVILICNYAVDLDQICVRHSH